MKTPLISVILSLYCVANAQTLVPMPSYFLVAIVKGEPKSAPKMISPHFTSQECYNARKAFTEENKLPEQIEVECVKIVKGVEA